MTVSMLSMALALMALTFTLINAARLWQQARRREMERIDREVQALKTWGRGADTALERLAGPGPLEPFTTCPDCNLSGYHLLSAPRTHVTANLWQVAIGSVWSGTSSRAEVEEMFSEVVVDRECLSCGKTWMETDPDLAAPQARSIPDGREVGDDPSSGACGHINGHGQIDPEGGCDRCET